VKEAAELASNVSPDYHAEPLESNLFEWHFTLRGPPAPSPYAGGIYHGRIVLPTSYPLRPPSFRFLTPSGRFEVNREICLSISGHHEETWQPAWGIRTALVAIRSFMDTDPKGQVGGMDSTPETRKRFASESTGWKCPGCGKMNAHIIKEREDAATETGAEKKEEHVPEELRLAYREDLVNDSKADPAAAQSPAAQSTTGGPNLTTKLPASLPISSSPSPGPQTLRSGTANSVSVGASSRPAQVTTPRQAQQQHAHSIPPWLDMAIYGVLLALLVMIIRKFLF